MVVLVGLAGTGKCGVCGGPVYCEHMEKSAPKLYHMTCLKVLMGVSNGNGNKAAGNVSLAGVKAKPAVA